MKQFSGGSTGTHRLHLRELYDPFPAGAIGDPNFFYLNAGHCATDLRHNLQSSWNFQSPFGNGKHWLEKGVAGAILGDWSLSGLFSYHTGFPFTATSQANVLNAVGSTNFANCGSNAFNSTGNIDQWYDTTQFSNPTTGFFWELRRQYSEGARTDQCGFRTQPLLPHRKGRKILTEGSR